MSVNKKCWVVLNLQPQSSTRIKRYFNTMLRMSEEAEDLLSQPLAITESANHWSHFSVVRGAFGGWSYYAEFLVDVVLWYCAHTEAVVYMERLARGKELLSKTCSNTSFLLSDRAFHSSICICRVENGQSDYFGNLIHTVLVQEEQRVWYSFSFHFRKHFKSSLVIFSRLLPVVWLTIRRLGEVLCMFSWVLTVLQ